jgi:hypothetical protein
MFPASANRSSRCPLNPRSAVRGYRVKRDFLSIAAESFGAVFLWSKERDMVAADKRKARMKVVRLASDEWGHELMWRVADETMTADASLDAVHVIEHGGWHLMFNRDGLVVGTANDNCRLSDRVLQWGQGFSGIEYVGSVSRD